MKNNKKEFGLLSIILVVVATAIVTSLTTGLLIFNNTRKSNEYKNSNDKSLQEFISVYNQVLNDYYEDVDKSEMINKAIEGMLNYLGDDYTTYMDSSDTKNLSEKLTGKYEGIGVEITDGNVITRVFDNSPAKESGILAGDIITKINDEDVSGLSTAELATKIKKGSKKFTITIKRGNVEMNLEVTKKELYVPAIESTVLDNNGKKTGYIYIASFSDTVYEQFKESLEKLENENIDNLIVDVRGNTGGYLKAATDIANLFLEKGKIIYSLEGKNTKEVFKDETEESRGYSVTVIINEASASASEILSAALRDSYGAKLVGKKSYGKGKVQQTGALEGGTMYKYTSAKWLTPNGECIDEKGLTPDYEADLQIKEDGTVVDTQLSKALEILGQ